MFFTACCHLETTHETDSTLVHLLSLGNSGHVSARDAAVANGVDGSLASSGKAVLGVDTLNTVGGVDVLDEGNLPAGSTTLAGSDGGGSQEVLPDLNKISFMIIHTMWRKLTLNHLLPYLASTFPRLPIQLRYHRQRVAE